MVKGHPCQTSWVSSGGPAQTHQVVNGEQYHSPLVTDQMESSLALQFL